MVEIDELRDATSKGLHRKLLSFQPHIFHFIGHAESNGLHLFTAEETNGSSSLELVDNEKINVLLKDTNISIAILNGCATASEKSREEIGSVAGILVNNGIPVVIGTTTLISDRQAAEFSKEFYRTLSEGFSLEDAVTEARKSIRLDDEVSWENIPFSLGLTGWSNTTLKPSERLSKMYYNRFSEMHALKYSKNEYSYFES